MPSFCSRAAVALIGFAAAATPALAQNLCMTSEIKLFAGAQQPNFWFFADGRLLPISQYQKLYSVIGTTYGGDGVTSFALPDMRGRATIGVGDLNNVTYYAGLRIGEETVTLTLENIPPHDHNVTTTVKTFASSGLASTGQADGEVLLASPRNDLIYAPDPPELEFSSTSTTATTALESTGTSAPVDISQPSLGLNYIICYDGVLPNFD